MTIAEENVMHQLAEARLAVYRFLLAALDKPSQRQHAWLSGADFRRTVERLSDEFSLPCPDGELVPEDYADHESRYLACFEVGVPEAPVPLLASHYNRREPAPRTIHEHILFFKRFGAQLAAGNREPADHLLNELAFLIRLDELLVAGEVEAESILRARHDFLSRQAGRWPAQAATAAEEKGLPALYCWLLALLAAALAQDGELSRNAIVRRTKEQS